MYMSIPVSYLDHNLSIFLFELDGRVNLKVSPGPINTNTSGRRLSNKPICFISPGAI